MSTSISPGGTADAGGSTATFNARLDRLPVITRSHRIWVVLLGFLFAFDLVDLNTFAYVAPALRVEWGISVTEVGVITSAAFVGMFFGAIVGGRLSDAYGRRPVVIGAGLCYSAFSLLSALAPNAFMLAAGRVLTGFGLQAMTGILLVYVSEMFPRERRGRFQSLILAVGLVGVPIAAVAARLVIPLGHGHWRWVFVIGGMGAIGAIAAIWLLPESVRWLAAHGRYERAEAELTQLEDQARRATGGELPEPVPTPPPTTGALRDLLAPWLLKRTIVNSLVMICLILGLYGFTAWTPTLLVERGYTPTQSLTYSLILSIGAVPGAILAWPMVDRWERKTVIFVITTVTAALLLAFGLVHSLAFVLVSGFLINVLLQAAVAVLYTYLPEVMPTHLRGLGAGIANGAGRLSGVAGGLIVAAVFSQLGYVAVFVYLTLAIFLLGLILVAAGERTTNQALEHIAGKR